MPMEETTMTDSSRIYSLIEKTIDLETYRDTDIASHHAGDMDSPCEHCHARNFEDEKVGQPPHFNICCQNGKVKLRKPMRKNLSEQNTHIRKA